MRRLISFLFLLVVTVTIRLSAQESQKWTLQACIDYALEQNIQLKQSKITLEQSEVDVKTARATLFPNLTFSAGQQLSYQPFTSSSSTTSTDKAVYSGSYGLNAQWIVWDANKRANTLRQKQTSSDISQLGVTEMENSLREEITKLFLQVLYAEESAKTNRGMLQVSQASYERGKQLLLSGTISKVDLAQLEAQVQNDSYLLVTSENTLRGYLLQLRQLMELSNAEPLELAASLPTEEYILRPLPEQDDVYKQAMAYRPEIQSSQLAAENDKLGITIAKSGYWPTISLNASSASATNSTGNINWGEQLKFGWNNSVGLTLSIPIFNNRQTKSAVEKARLQYNSSLLTLLNEQKALYKTIETLRLDAANAQEQYRAASSKVQSNEASYAMVSEQFSLGMKNTLELLTEKTNLSSARQQLLQAKYMVLLNRTLLSFYAGNTTEL